MVGITEFTYSSVETQRVRRMQFGVLSPEEIVSTITDRYEQSLFLLTHIWYMSQFNPLYDQKIQIIQILISALYMIFLRTEYIESDVR